MRENWPHAPPHYFPTHGIYIITAATLHRKRLFDSKPKLNLFRDTTFELGRNYQLLLQAWAFFSNHYHLVVSFENSATSHRDFIRHLHRELAVRLNRMDTIPGRRVMYEFWDTHLTFERSWLARLNYVHQNAVKHDVVPVGNQYRGVPRLGLKAMRDPILLNQCIHSRPTRSACPTISECRAGAGVKGPKAARGRARTPKVPRLRDKT